MSGTDAVESVVEEFERGDSEAQIPFTPEAEALLGCEVRIRRWLWHKRPITTACLLTRRVQTPGVLCTPLR